MIATEYNLTKKIEGGDKKSEDHKKSLDENHQVIGSTRERIATKHNVTPWMVQTSVELAEALDAIKEVAQNNSKLYNSFTLSFPKLPNLPKNFPSFRTFRIILQPSASLLQALPIFGLKLR